MFQTQGFNELSEAALAYILYSDNLTLDEVDILDHVKHWANVNAVSEQVDMLATCRACNSCVDDESSTNKNSCLNMKVTVLLLSHPQVVTNTDLADVAKNIILHVRFPLLDPDTLSEIEEENAKRPFIPVSANSSAMPATHR